MCDPVSGSLWRDKGALGKGAAVLVVVIALIGFSWSWTSSFRKGLWCSGE